MKKGVYRHYKVVNLINKYKLSVGIYDHLVEIKAGCKAHVHDE